MTTHDALGRRMSRENPSGTTTDFLDDGNSVLLEQQGSTTTATYLYGSALVRKDGEYPLFDALGSERTVANSSQTVTGSVIYDGFGNTVATSGSSTDPYMFGATSGYRNDGDAGLMLVGARYYDPAVGRFITRDSDLSEYPFVYCDGDPIDGLDPTGHGGNSLQKELITLVLRVLASLHGTRALGPRKFPIRSKPPTYVKGSPPPGWEPPTIPDPPVWYVGGGLMDFPALVFIFGPDKLTHGGNTSGTLT